MTTRILMATVTLTTLGFLGCGVGQLETGDQVQTNANDRHNQLMSWEEFNQHVYQEAGTGVYIVDGDTAIVGEKNLREFYDSRIAVNADQSGTGMLIVDTVNGADDKWPTATRHNMTYCINKSAFGSHYAAVVQAMSDATAAWSGACDLQWTHVTAQDTSCTASNAAVLFDVNPVNAGGQYIARSFFPSTARAERNVLIDGSAFTSSGDPTLTGVLRHELGHTIGFRHEHTRPEAGTCFEDNNWRPLTPYDQASVMHYPQCNGGSSWALVLTSYDQQGCAALYGAPGSTTCTPSCSGKACGSDGCGGVCGTCSAGASCDSSGQCQGTAPAPAPGVTTETVNGSVAKGGTVYYGPYSVTSSTQFDVVMSGTGDPDLYVHFGAKPTTAAYECRPYLDGAAESCSNDVTPGKTTAYLMVKGYTASTFKLVITYTKGGSSGATPPPASTGTAKVTAVDGTVATGKVVNYNPITVLAGTTFQVVMSGNGDPDLYVRFGAAPTTAAYNCRPYLDGAAETCTVTVPAGQSQAYIMINGYAASTYHLAINYTAP